MTETHEFSRFNTLLTQADVFCEGSLVTKHALFVSDMCIAVAGGQLHVYHLKQDVVPRALLHLDSTLVAEFATSCEQWFELALDRSLVNTIAQCFPVVNLEVDFTRENLLESEGITLTSAQINALQPAIEALGVIDADYLTQLQALVGADSTINQAIIALQQKDLSLDQDVASLVAKDLSLDQDVASLVAKDLSLDQDVSGIDTRLQAAEGFITQLDDVGDTLDQISEVKSAYETLINSTDQSLQALISDKVAVSVYNDRVVSVNASLADRYEKSVVDGYLSGKQATIAADDLSISYTSGLQSSLDAKQATLSQAQLDVCAGEVYSTAEKQKVQSSTDVLGSRTATQLSYLDATSSIQTQIGAKQATLSQAQLDVCAGEVYSTAEKQKVQSSTDILGSRTATQLSYLDATSSIQTQIGSKQSTLSQAQLDVCAGEVYSTAEKSKVQASTDVLGSRTSTQLSYVDGTSSIQTQLNGKQATLSFGSSQGDVVKAGSVASSSKAAMWGSGADAGFLISKTDSNFRTDLDLYAKDEVYSQTEADALLDTKCSKTADESWSGAKTLTHNSSTPPLVLNNSNADQCQLQCTGNDGSCKVMGGANIEFSRDANCAIKCPSSNASFLVQTRGATRCTFSDKTAVNGRLDCGSLFVNSVEVTGGSVTTWTVVNDTSSDFDSPYEFAKNTSYIWNNASGAVNSSNSTNSFNILPADASVGDFVEVLVATQGQQGRIIYYGCDESTDHKIYVKGSTSTSDGQLSDVYSSNTAYWAGNTDKNNRDVYIYAATNAWIRTQ